MLLDTEALRQACERSADARLARIGLERIVAAHPGLGAELHDDPQLLESVVAIVCASDALLDVMVNDEAAIAVLRGDLHEPLSAEEMQERALALGTATDSSRVLRQWKRRQLVRIAARDLLGLATLPVVAGELACLAASCLQAAVAAADPDARLAVIGMGKLGGHELNYASDVDVMFVHSGDDDDANRAARRVLRTMSERTADGVLFRTDATLRPEGRSGALSRSVESYSAYWDRWAAPWEVQALLKARPVAGDAALGAAFAERLGARVWSGAIDADGLREIRLLKARSEAGLSAAGREGDEVKRGRGGIRDIEFSVQILQLVHGPHDPAIRTANTLEGLERLAEGQYFPRRDAGALDEAYRWLRTVEHRLQLVHEQQTHTLPSDPAARVRIARVLGFRDTPDSSAIEQFDAAHRRQLASVRGIHERVYFEPILDALAGSGALPLDAALERLDAFGFRDAEQTRTAVLELTAGLTRRSRLMRSLFPVLLGWLSDAPDPDLGLLQLRRLSEGYTRSQTLARVFRETPIAAQRVCRVLGSSRVLGAALHRQPEFVDVYADDARLATERPRVDVVNEALGALDWREGEDGRWLGLRRFKRRELLRVGSRNLLGFADLDTAARELSNLADAALEAALRSLETEVPFAVIGMGRLGGKELSYASDIDVIFVYEGSGSEAFAAAERAAVRLMRAIGATTSEGATFRIDADLRPEGRQGALARSLDGYREYYGRWAQPWELQALLRARPAAGDPELGRRFCEMAESFVYRADLPDTEVREIRRIKARIEKERVPPHDDPRFHLKLGPGALTDVEFTAQLLQLRHGAALPTVRTPSTRAALRGLRDEGLLDESDARILLSAYDLCERARNARFLLTASIGDALPVDGDEAVKLGRMLGFTSAPASQLRDEYLKATRRARRVVERVFYGRD